MISDFLYRIKYKKIDYCVSKINILQEKLSAVYRAFWRGRGTKHAHLTLRQSGASSYR